MRVKCEYCGSLIDDTEKVCPNCGAPNEHMARSADGIPKTIEELKTFCESHGLPLSQMRFFIGENCEEPKAFGIYKDNDGCFVVYKNKSNGERIVRYRGTDEDYAVNELYQKLRTELQERRGMGQVSRKDKAAAGVGSGASPLSAMSNRTKLIIGVAAAVLLIFIVFCYIAGSSVPDRGYYRYNGVSYYNDMGPWYEFNKSTDSWMAVDSVDDELQNNYRDYYLYDDYPDNAYYGNLFTAFNVDLDLDFDNSGVSNGSVNADDDWDSGWDDDDFDWDSGDSWDFGDTDWDSDW